MKSNKTSMIQYKSDSCDRICCVIPSLASGGMERVMAMLVNGFVNYNNEEIHLILYGSEREVFYEVDPRVIIHKPSFGFDNKHRRYYTLKTFLYLRKEIKTIHPKSVLSFGCFYNSLFDFRSAFQERTPDF